MRLLVLSTASSAHTVRWVRALSDRGHDVSLFSLTPPADALTLLERIRITSPGIQADVARAEESAFGKLRYLRALPLLRSHIRNWRPDLVHAHYASSYGLLATLAGARPLIVSAWGMDVYSFPNRSILHRRAMQHVLTNADAVLSTSHVMRDRVRELVDRPVYVTPFGVDTDRFSPRRPPRPSGALRVGTVKTLEEKYGIEFLLRAFSIVRRQGSHAGGYKLTIVGDGSLRKALEQLAQEIGIAQDVEFVGYRPYSEVHEWHQTFDVAVYPSIDESESFGVAAVESQSCGAPVVVSRIGGLPEVVVEGRSGLIVPPRDVDALAAAMLAILDSVELRQTMGQYARQYVIDTYSLDVCSEIMQGIYRRVLDENRKPGPRMLDGTHA